MIEADAKIKTRDGSMDAFICHPDEGGPAPAVIIYMDAPAIREELRDFARRLATVGYYVILPNLYYRVGTEGNYGFDRLKAAHDEGERTKMLDTMRLLNNELIVSDTRALIDFVRQDAAAKDGPMGCVGYCMSGQFVVSIGAAYPDDFAAIASYYGVGIMTDEADSPHLKFKDIKGEMYLAFASEDMWVPQTLLDQLPGIMEESGVNGRMEIYPDTDHAFAFPQRAVYKRWAGERHWERMFSLFERRLKLA